VALIHPREKSEDIKGNGIKRTKGINRCRTKHLLRDPSFKALYRKGAMIKCINSVCKMLFGDSVISRKNRSITAEVLRRAVAHNLERINKLGIGESFV